MLKRSLVLIFVLGFAVMYLVGCSGGPKTFGEAISLKDATPISAILADAKGYENKAILVDGKITLECPTGCWFDVTDKTGTIYVDIASGGGFSIPQKTGSQVLVEGTVDIGESGLPFILGKGVEIR